MHFLLGVRFPNLSSSVTFTTKGPTAGLVNVSDIPKESPAPTEKELVQIGNSEVTLLKYYCCFVLLEMRTKLQVLIYL